MTKLSKATIEKLKKIFGREERDPEAARRFTESLPEIRDTEVTGTVIKKKRK